MKGKSFIIGGLCFVLTLCGHPSTPATSPSTRTETSSSVERATTTGSDKTLVTGLQVNGHYYLQGNSTAAKNDFLANPLTLDGPANTVPYQIIVRTN